MFQAGRSMQNGNKKRKYNTKFDRSQLTFNQIANLRSDREMQMV